MVLPLVSSLALLVGLGLGLVIGARAGFLALRVAARAMARDRVVADQPAASADIRLVA